MLIFSDNSCNPLILLGGAVHEPLARGTLMRLEERGLLTPAYISPGSGRRYYDNHNVSRVIQIQHFQDMGLSSEEIFRYYNSNGDTNTNLAILEAKMLLLQRSVEELTIRSQMLPNMNVTIM